MMRFLLPLLSLLLVVLVACGSSTIVQTTQTESYKVQMTLDRAALGDRTIMFEINDLGGSPISDAEVIVAPVMRDMGMASPEMSATMVAPGRYEVKGRPFSMLGIWEFDVRIDVNGNEQVATFKFEVLEA
jgi:hypothetical protein